MDTSSIYVRGEENLRGWRPRRESLIFDHRELQSKLLMLEEVRRSTYVCYLVETPLLWNVYQNPSKGKILIQLYFHVEYTCTSKGRI